jgi:SAM-dependent methyltransferase
MEPASLALLELARTLVRDGYRFVTPTPETHRRVVARRERARDLRDVFGWSLPFAPSLLPPALLALLHQADAVRSVGDDLRARVRFSTLGDGRSDALYVHSAFPTDEVDAVFFGPDTYRFCSFLRRAAPRATTVVDIGCGTGAGGLVAARAAGATRVVLADVNQRALGFARINAALAAEREHALGQASNAATDRSVEVTHSDVLASIDGELDLIVANPPYMRDEAARAYRDGGGNFGEALSLRIAREALARLAPGGTLLLYTGAAVVAGEDVFRAALAPLLGDYPHAYEELDPDVFGEELEQPGYQRVERIAAVALSVRRPA